MNDKYGYTYKSETTIFKSFKQGCNQAAWGSSAGHLQTELYRKLHLTLTKRQGKVDKKCQIHIVINYHSSPKNAQLSDQSSTKLLIKKLLCSMGFSQLVNCKLNLLRVRQHWATSILDCIDGRGIDLSVKFVDGLPCWWLWRRFIGGWKAF